MGVNDMICKAKAKENGEWVIGDPYGCQYSSKKEPHFQILVSPRHHQEECKVCEVFRDTVCRISPYFDKNSKQIFDNDILKDDTGMYWIMASMERTYGSISAAEWQIISAEITVTGMPLVTIRMIPVGTLKKYEIVGNKYDKFYEDYEIGGAQLLQHFEREQLWHRFVDETWGRTEGENR